MKIETQVGAPISAGKYRIYPVSKVLKAQMGNFPAGLVWNRASAVLVESGGSSFRLPLRDATRRGQLLLFGIALVSWLVAWRSFRR